ncbi:hypothetical protein [Prochlorococcus sp. ALOHA_ZT_50]|uniref:hypothetical protein n=1 Tax=Prochlorococcus sp. ALOHA_ZT_50 TaxID=2919303 RepID=UPI00257DD87A|nr:hypothetical protein [Prochlorococcus sp. ALOHA_ZT_50]MCH2079601.1 hypothetical protein [Prochlorococcus sp. ALOHA_ZT_50]
MIIQSEKKLLALDISLSNTGYFFDHENRGVLSPPKLKAGARLSWFRKEFEDLFHSTSVVWVEGYSYGSKFGREALAELHGVAYILAYQFGLNVYRVPPTTIKAFLGNGKAKKDQVAELLYKKTGKAYSSHDLNDAYALNLFANEVTEAKKKSFLYC